MKSVRQVLAIARTEFRFGLRRGAPVVVTALIGLIVSAGLLLLPFSNLGEWSSSATNMTPEEMERWTANGFTPAEHPVFIRAATGDLFVYSSSMAWILTFLALLLLPVATAVTIPADRKFGVLELLRSTPITGARYLTGKILGVFATVLFIGLIIILLAFVVIEGTLFSFLHFGLSQPAIKFYIELIVLDGLPLLLWGTTVGVLIGVLFRTRRGAIFPGLLAGFFSLIFWAFTFRAPAYMLPMTDITEYYLLQNYHSLAQTFEAKVLGQEISLLGEGAPRLGIGHVLMMYLVILSALLALAYLARLWLQRKENF